MDDHLPAIIKAAEQRETIPVPPDQQTITLISMRGFTSTDIPRIRRFQRLISAAYGVHLIAAGGGYGCTRIVFIPVPISPEHFATMLNEALQSSFFQIEARDAGFTILITSDPYQRIPLDSPTNHTPMTIESTPPNVRFDAYLTALQTPEEINAEILHQQNRKKKLIEHLHELEIKDAKFGLDGPAYIKTEMNDTKQKITLCHAIITMLIDRLSRQS
jgi:hypothetical protein